MEKVSLIQQAMQAWQLPEAAMCLTGILTGLLAQGYSSIESAILGVYLHGLAGILLQKNILWKRW